MASVQAEAKAAKPIKEKIDAGVLRVALILAFGAVASQLDSTMINVALDKLSTDLHSTVSAIQWVVTGYVLTMGLAVPVSSWAIQRFGGKSVYLFSLIIFLVSSILCGLAWDTGSLIGFRLLQGVGAGLLVPTMQNVLVQSAGGRNLGRLIAIISIPALIGPILGPVIGGLLIDNLDWRWIFYVNIPIMLVAIWLSWRHIPIDAPARDKPRLDILGLLLLSPAFAGLIYGIAEAGTHGGLGHMQAALPLAGGLVLAGAYIVYTLRTRHSPLLDLRLFRSRHFLVSNVTLFLTGMVLNGAMLLLPLYYQQVRGEGVLETGLLLIPQGLGMLATRSWIGGLADRMGSRNIVLLSLVVTAIGTIPFAFSDTETSHVLLGIAQFMRGAALNGIFIPIMVSAYDGLRKDQIPHASVSTRIFQTIGGAFGSAILATVIDDRIRNASMPGMSAAVDAYQAAFWWSTAFAVLAVIPALMLSKGKK